MTKNSRGTYLNTTKLLSVYKRMKSGDANKVWVARDFLSGHNRNHLDLLVSLDLIEQVKCFYYWGVNQATTNIRGYKIKVVRK